MAHAEAQQWEQVALHNENDRFKAKYPKYLRGALGISLIIYLLVFLFSPTYVPNPYKLREETIEVLDIPESIDIPPPPQEIPRPQVPIEAAPDAEVDEEVEIAETMFDDFDSMQLPPTGGGMTGTEFVAFDTKPEVINYAQPNYPEVAREMELHGRVLVNVLVGTDGRVMEAVIAQSVHHILDQEALKAARKCTFTPGKQRDIPVPVWVTIPYNFVLF